MRSLRVGLRGAAFPVARTGPEQWMTRRQGNIKNLAAVRNALVCCDGQGWHSVCTARLNSPLRFRVWRIAKQRDESIGRRVCTKSSKEGKPPAMQSACWNQRKALILKRIPGVVEASYIREVRRFEREHHDITYQESYYPEALKFVQSD